MFSDLPAFRRDTLGFFLDKCKNATAPLEKLHVGPHPIYLVADPDLVKPVFNAPESEIDKGRLIYKMREVLGRSSLTLNGDEHKERRAAIHARLAKGMTTTYVPEISAIVRRYTMMAAQQGSFDAHGIGAPLALRVICDVLFGREALSRGDEAALVNTIKLVEDDVAEKIFRVFPDLPWVAKRKKEKLRQGREIMMQVVERARQKASDASILQGLLELNLDDEGLRDEILLIILAGHHTTGSAAAWIFYYMALYPDLVENLAKEAADIGDETGEIIPEKLYRDAPVSRAFANEVLRLFPSSYWMSRETMADVELGGMPVKAGTSLIICPWAFGRDPKFWDDPEEFRLDRSYANRAFVPFGAGPRVCVGGQLAMVELQLMALEFASAFEFTGVTPNPAPLPKPSLTLVPPRMEVTVKPRAHRAEPLISTHAA
ncbi:putative Unspecific monooxygenase,cytochrome P450 superfamily [Magnetospira sp. QH-2]|nr:putative Unspecific monooxygenase,cytochrome P450 superfamily [Magnetospira sp. QH-2]